MGEEAPETGPGPAGCIHHDEQPEADEDENHAHHCRPPHATRARRGRHGGGLRRLRPHRRQQDHQRRRQRHDTTWRGYERPSMDPHDPQRGGTPSPSLPPRAGSRTTPAPISPPFCTPCNGSGVQGSSRERVGPPVTSTETATTPGAADSAGEMIRTVDLTKVYAGTDFRAVDELNLVRARRRDLRPPRAERRRQDHHGGDAHHAGHPHLGRGLRGGRRRRRPPRAGQAAPRGGVTAEHSGPPAQLLREPLLPRAPVRHAGPPSAPTRRRAARAVPAGRWAKASVYALSGGMAQRLMVARSIFHRPAVLFLDEPTSGLDPQSRLALWDILGELNRDGQTIVLMTHYMEEADQLCHRVAIMDHGRILALDTPGRAQGHGRGRHHRHGAGGRRRHGSGRRPRTERRGRHPGPRLEGGAELHVRGRPGVLPRWWPQPSGAASSWPICRWPSPPWRRCSSTSPARTCATDDDRPTPPRARRGDRRRERAGPTRIGAEPLRSAAAASRTALYALLLRDLTVLRKHMVEFVARTIIQPFLLVFVFLFVFPQIGQSVGRRAPGASSFATVLVPGVVGITIMFQGVQSVALQLSQEFGFTREIEDRVQAPCPVWLVAVAKVLSGVVQGIIAAVIVFPIAAVVHAGGVHAHLDRALVGGGHAAATHVPGVQLARPAARVRVRTTQHRAYVRVHRAAHHLPGRHLLPVDPPARRCRSAGSAGCRRSCA